MEFFILVLINIFMGAVFYLFITLKLERSASEFREQRLRREMDEIIREFNAAAERNITLLENRISQYKKLLGKTGDYDVVDYTVGGEDFKTSSEIKTSSAASPVKSYKEEPLPDNEPGRRITLNDLVEHARNKFERFKKDLAKKIPAAPAKPALSPAHEPVVKQSAAKNKPVKKTAVKPDAPDKPVIIKESEKHEDEFVSPIQKSFSDIYPEIASEFSSKRPKPADEETAVRPAIPESVKVAVSDEEILQIIKSGGDKMKIVSDLSSRGLHADEISGYTGIPQGEVKLIMNLSAGGR